MGHVCTEVSSIPDAVLKKLDLLRAFPAEDAVVKCDAQAEEALCL